MTAPPDPTPKPRTALAILKDRRFLGLFVAQFAGAANDNLFKNAMGVLLVFRIGAWGGIGAPILVSLAAGIFILPFFLFSARAGLLADRRSKQRLLRRVKAIELPLALLGALGLWGENTPLLLAALFLLGTQAAFLGPLKYSILPELMAGEEVVAANALVEGGTFLAILAGTIAGGLLILAPGGALVVGGLMLALSLAGIAAAWFVPETPPGDTALKPHPGLFGETRHVLADLALQPLLWRVVLGISWFWYVGATFLAQFPAFARDILCADEQVVTLMLTMFSLGIGAGSMACARLLQGRLSFRPVWLAGLAIAVFSADLAFSAGPVGQADALAGLGAFIQSWTGIRVLVDLALVALAGGFYAVPLYSALQIKAGADRRGRMVGANNIVNAAFMVVSALAGAALLGAGAGILGIFLATALVTLAGALWPLRRLAV